MRFRCFQAIVVRVPFADVSGAFTNFFDVKRLGCWSWIGFYCKDWDFISTSEVQILTVNLCAGGICTKQIVAAPRIPVNRLYPVHPQDDGVATFDVVFFHGLQIVGGTAAQEAYRTTWTNKDNVLWPQVWLPNDLDNIRVFSLSYDAEATKWFGQGNTEDVEYIGENLFQSLVM
jgi:hypothetical protein